jgi:AcrR family transcriptional regulator
MSKGASTREAIVGEASRQALRVGLEGLSLGVLADRLGLSKSGLFAHFKSKEALQLAVLDAAASRFTDQVVRPALSRPSGRDRLEALFDQYLDWMTDGCLFSVVAQEVDKLPAAVATAFVDGQARWRDTVARVAADVVRPGVDPGEVAFAFGGLALAYQQSVKVFHDADARGRALGAFTRSLEATT